MATYPGIWNPNPSGIGPIYSGSPSTGMPPPMNYSPIAPRNPGYFPVGGNGVAAPNYRPAAPISPATAGTGTAGVIGDPFAPGVAGAAIATQSSDYDRIMKEYQNHLNSIGSGPKPITAQQSTYSRAPDLSAALAKFKEYSETGGISDDEASNMRARAVSPLRSIYSSANRNLNRQRAIQGGYAPGFGASTARMAREMSEQIGQANTNVEASLAELRGQGRLSAMGQYAPLVGEQERMRLGIESENTAAQNRAMEFNQQMQADIINKRMQAIEGMRGLFGTQPGLASTFGDQVLRNKEIESRNQDVSGSSTSNDINLALGLISNYGRVPNIYNTGRGRTTLGGY